MSAVVIPFPERSTLPIAAFDGALAVMAPGWREQHWPLVEAAVDLLRCGEAEMARRCALMGEAEGRAMAEILCARVEFLGDQVGELADALHLAADRVRGAMGL